MATSQKKNNTKISFALVLVGLMFFFNPCVNLFDVLPDIIGALLVYAGLKKAEIADGYFEDARKLSFYMIWLYAIKLAFSFTVLSNSDNALPYTFISSTLEIIILLSFFHKLFSGFEYTLMRCENGRADVPVNEAYAYSIIFVIAKCVITFLPELFELAIQGEDTDLSVNAGYYMTTANVKNYAILLGLFIQLILGIIFIVMMCRFFAKVRGHKAYIAYLAEKYDEEIVAYRPKYINRYLSTACTLAIVSVVFTADVFIDGVDFLPDVFAAIAFILCMRSLCNVGSYVKFPTVPTVLLCVTSVASTVVNTYITPERFELLSHERSMLETHSQRLFSSSVGVVVTSGVGVLFTLSVIYAVMTFISENKAIFSRELMGNHDRKLLTVGVTVSLTALLKTANCISQAVCATYASNKAVSEFISGRPMMTAQKMNQAIASSDLVSGFTTSESVSAFFSWAMLIVAVFAVFGIFSLKAEAVKED